MDRVPPSEGGGCPFEPGREQFRCDETFIRRAIELAAEAGAAGEVPVGAVFAVANQTFEAANEKERRPDPTAHAEILVLRAAAAQLGVWRLGGTLYVSKEPCAMCAGALAAARVERLVYGCSDPKGGAAGSVIDVLASSAVNHRVAVQAGVLGDEAAQQLKSYFRSKRLSIPTSERTRS